MTTMNQVKQNTIIYPNFLWSVQYLVFIFCGVLFSITHNLFWLCAIPLGIYIFLNSLTSISINSNKITVHYAIKNKVELPLDEIRNFYRGVEKSRRGKREYLTIRLKSSPKYFVFRKADFWNYKKFELFLKENLTESIEKWPPEVEDYLFKF